MPQDWRDYRLRAARCILSVGCMSLTCDNIPSDCGVLGHVHVHSHVERVHEHTIKNLIGVRCPVPRPVRHAHGVVVVVDLAEIRHLDAV